MRRWPLLCGIAIVACGAEHRSTGTGESEHTEGELIWANELHSWADLDRGTLDAHSKAKTAPEDNLVTRRVQAWIDRYDAVVRAVVHDTSGAALAAPVPHARVILDTEINAMVLQIPACITSAKDPDTLPPDTNAVLTIQNTTSIGADRLCLPAKNWDPASGLAWVKTLGHVDVKANGALFDVGFVNGESHSAVNAAILAATPFVNVNSSLISRLSEKSVGAAIAHELGHYYRAHNTVLTYQQNDFWFDADAPVAARPAPVANAAAYDADYAGVRAPSLVVEGQAVSPRIAITFVKWASMLQTKSTHVCAPAVAAIGALSPMEQNDLLSGTAPITSVSLKQAYLDFEPKMNACVEALKLVDGAGHFPLDGVQASRSWFVRQIEPTLSHELTSDELAHVATLHDLVVALDAGSDRLDVLAAQFAQRLHDNHIGRYTNEQEADEISMDLAARIGLTPNDVIAGIHELMVEVEKDDPVAFKKQNGVSSAECDALLASKSYVPLGDLADPHHSFCYRLFNFARERDVHAYRVADPNLPPDSPPWADVQSAANTLQSGMAAPQPAAPTAPDASIIIIGDGGTQKFSPPSDPINVTADPGPPPADTTTTDPDAGGPHVLTRTRVSSSCAMGTGMGRSRSGGSWPLLLGIAALASRLRRRRR